MTRLRYLIPHVNPTPWKAPDNIPTRKGNKVFCKSVTPAVVKDYQTQIKTMMGQLYPDLEPTPKGQHVALKFGFYRKLGYRAQHCDATNLQKSTEDALQGVLFENDRDVLYVASWIHEQSKETHDLIVVDFWPNADAMSGVDTPRPSIHDDDVVPWAIQPPQEEERNIRFVEVDL